jgi:hypothetical protein
MKMKYIRPESQKVIMEELAQSLPISDQQTGEMHAKFQDLIDDEQDEQQEVLSDRQYLGEKRFDGIVKLWED